MTRQETRLLNTMRNLSAQGWRDESALVNAAAQAIGGDEAAVRKAQRIFDVFFKISEAN